MLNGDVTSRARMVGFFVVYFVLVMISIGISQAIPDSSGILVENNNRTNTYDFSLVYDGKGDFVMKNFSLDPSRKALLKSSAFHLERLNVAVVFRANWISRASAIGAPNPNVSASLAIYGFNSNEDLNNLPKQKIINVTNATLFKSGSKVNKNSSVALAYLNRLKYNNYYVMVNF